MTPYIKPSFISAMQYIRECYEKAHSLNAYDINRQYCCAQQENPNSLTIQELDLYNGAMIELWATAASVVAYGVAKFGPNLSDNDRATFALGAAVCVPYAPRALPNFLVMYNGSKVVAALKKQDYPAVFTTMVFLFASMIVSSRRFQSKVSMISRMAFEIRPKP